MTWTSGYLLSPFLLAQAFVPGIDAQDTNRFSVRLKLPLGMCVQLQEGSSEYNGLTLSVLNCEACAVPCPSGSINQVCSLFLLSDLGKGATD